MSGRDFGAKGLDKGGAKRDRKIFFGDIVWFSVRQTLNKQHKSVSIELIVNFLVKTLHLCKELIL